jgi:hypothetical protein
MQTCCLPAKLGSNWAEDHRRFRWFQLENVMIEGLGDIFWGFLAIGAGYCVNLPKTFVRFRNPGYHNLYIKSIAGTTSCN